MYLILGAFLIIFMSIFSIGLLFLGNWLLSFVNEGKHDKHMLKRGLSIITAGLIGAVIINLLDIMTI